VSVEALRSEASRIHCELSFQSLERQRGAGNQVVEHWRKRLFIKHVENAVVVRRAVNELKVGRGAKVRHESAGAHRAVDLERGGENHVGQRQRRTTALLLWRRDICQQVTEQCAKRGLLAGLRLVVGAPVLRIGDARGASLNHGAVWLRLSPEHEFDSVSVLARFASKLEIRASAGIAVGATEHTILSVHALRGDAPFALAPSGNRRGRRDFKSPLTPRAQGFIQHSHIVATTQLHVKSGDFLTCSYVLATLWPVAKTNKRRARPAAKPRKDDVVRMRVSGDQKEALTTAAQRDGLELSAWLRQLALKAAGALPEAK
jgi:hypothetical protein